MSADDAPAPPLKRKSRKLLLAASVAVAAGGMGLAFGPLAPWIVDQLADGQRVWRLGTIEIDGVSGAHIGGLRAARVTLQDEQGVWLEAHNVALDWRPAGLLLGHVRIDAGAIERVHVLRRPVLGERRISSGARFDVRVDALSVSTIDLEPAVADQAATFRAAFAMNLQDRVWRRLNLDLVRTDSDADRAQIIYQDDRAFAVSADVSGAAGGVFSTLLGVAEHAIGFEAEGAGDTAQGAARFAGALGDVSLADGAVTWTPTTWTLDTDARFDVLPALASLTERIGGSAAILASGERRDDDEPTRFMAHAETPFITLDLEGLRREGLELDGPARIVATTNRLSAIGHESPFELGAARFEGEITRRDGNTELEGVFTAREMQVLGRIAAFSGPARAELTSARFELDADLRAPEGADPLFANARLRTKFDYDRSSRRFTLSPTTLVGDAIALDAVGWTTRGEGEYSGDWRLKQIETLVPDMRGGGAGRWRAHAEAAANDTRVWVATVDGAGANLSGAPAIIPDLLGPSPRLDGLFRVENGGVTVSHLRVDGAKLRAGATGRLVDGQADLAIEASARGPIVFGAVDIAGNIDATGRMTGTLSRPALTMQAQLASILVPGAEIVQPTLEFSLAPDAGGAYRGAAELRGGVHGQPLIARSDVVIENGAFALPTLVAEVGELRASGPVSFSDAGPNADLAISGSLNGLGANLAGRVQGNVQLTPESVQIDAQLADARAGDLRLRAATITANGPYSAIHGQIDLRGALRQAPMAFSGAIDVINDEDGAAVRLTGAGELAGVAIATRGAPIEMRWRDGATEASWNVTIADGAVAGQWRERGRALSGSVTLEDAPLAPLAAIWGERATGRIEGVASIQSEGDGLSGAADIALEDARFAGRSRGLLNVRLTGNLTPNRLSGRLEATSSEGLRALIEGEAPVTTSAAPILIALAPERRGRATWTVNGPVEGLWAAARLADQALEGDIEGEGELTFGAGSLEGDGRIEIVNGRFEDKISGIKLEQLNARIGIGDNGVVIEQFTATDSRGGRLSATGGSANPREGNIALTIRDLRLIDRPDASARANGELAFQWEGLQSTLSGSLDIQEANISIATLPEAGIPMIEVVEINRPEGDIIYFDDEAPATNATTRLDVRIRAPGRVFTRGRGVDAEWSLNMRLAGTAADPLLYGEARAVRGTLSLSGQPFEITTGRIVFDGAAENARIDLIAERDTADFTARIGLSGTANDPEVTLTSDPALPEDEILPQVLFGRSMADLSGLEAAQLAASLATLSGRASFDLIDAARAASGLDRFNVREDEDGGFLVAGGVYLTRDVYLEVARTGLGQAATRVEWTIRPRLVLITSFLANGDQRASIRWRRETD